jgi:hypothetical protein
MFNANAVSELFTPGDFRGDIMNDLSQSHTVQGERGIWSGLSYRGRDKSRSERWGLVQILYVRTPSRLQSHVEAFEHFVSYLTMQLVFHWEWQCAILHVHVHSYSLSQQKSWPVIRNRSNRLKHGSQTLARRELRRGARGMMRLTQLMSCMGHRHAMVRIGV